MNIEGCHAPWPGPKLWGSFVWAVPPVFTHSIDAQQTPFSAPNTCAGVPLIKALSLDAASADRVAREKRPGAPLGQRPLAAVAELKHGTGDREERGR